MFTSTFGDVVLGLQALSSSDFASYALIVAWQELYGFILA